MKQKFALVFILLVLLVSTTGTAFAQKPQPPAASGDPAVLPKSMSSSQAGNQLVEGVLPANPSADLIVTPTIINRNFDQGLGVGWTVFSTHGWPIIQSPGTGLVVTPRSPNYAAWLGGDDDDASYIEQGNISIINPTHLRFWYWIGSQELDCIYDFGYLRINGSVAASWNLCQANNTNGWRAFDMDLSSYNGQTITLRLEVVTDFAVNSNLFIDDVALYSTFADVPYDHLFWSQIEAFYDAGLTTGCVSASPKLYCPYAQVNRAEMATFIERALGNFAPTPNPTGMFSDVPYAGLEHLTPFIEEFYNDGLTTGCAQGPLRYCPQNNVTRAEMATFIERALGNFAPTPNPTGMFADVPWGGLEHLTPFIEEFYNDGITTGCAVSPLRFCPANLVTRQEMAVFIVRAFNIPLP